MSASKIKNGKNKSSSESILYALVDGIIVEEVMKAAGSYQVLEMGAGDGKLSFRLATLMGTLNPEALLCCVDDMSQQEGVGKWQEKISMVSAPPRLAMVLADLEDLPLQTDAYDLIILNKSISDNCSLESLKECKRLLKDGGKIVCHIKEAWKLEEAFGEIFSQEYDVHQISLSEKALSAVCKKEVRVTREEALTRECVSILEELNDILMRDGRKASYKNVVKQIEQYLESISDLGMDEREKDFYRLKECILNYMFNLNDEFASFYRRKVVEQIEKMKSC